MICTDSALFCRPSAANVQQTPRDTAQNWADPSRLRRELAEMLPEKFPEVKVFITRQTDFRHGLFPPQR